MRVLLITGSFPPDACGVGDYTYQLAKALSRNPNHAVAVLTTYSSCGLEEKLPFGQFSEIRNWRLRELPTIARVIRKWAPDVVHVQLPTQGYGRGGLPWAVPLIAKLLGCKPVQTWHEPLTSRQLPKLLLQSAVPSPVVVVRPHFANSLSILVRWILWNKHLMFIPNASAFPKINLRPDERERARLQYLCGRDRLVVYFGFLYPDKNVELLFDIADPGKDQIVIAGGAPKTGKYTQKILGLAGQKRWTGHATVTGFLENAEVSKLLAIADAVVLPFRSGGGNWNSSIHAATAQGAFVLTTSRERVGYDSSHNIYYAAPEDVTDMKAALEAYAGRRRQNGQASASQEVTWDIIARQHMTIYESL